MYRSSTGNLSSFDEPLRGGERWDRDRFERMRGGRGGASARGDEHDHYRFQEHDRFPGGRRDIDIHEDYDRRGPPTRVMERERFREVDVPPSRRRNDFFHEDTPSEIANRALAPYRRKSIVERDMDIAPRRVSRPQYIRRQSSLDTFDRRPMPRYGDVEHDRDEWRPPTNVPIPLPIRQRRASPPRYEDDYEEIRYTEREREPRRSERVEEYREVEVSRAKSRRRRSPSRARSVAKSTRSSSTSSFEEVEPVRANWGKKGKTRLPKRLCRKEAVIELGYPFEEEDDFIIVRRALEKEHIDEIIKTSENYKESTKTTYVYENKEFVEATPPPPPPPPEVIHVPPPPASVAPSHHSHHTHHTQVHVAPPPPASVHYAQSVRSASPPHHHDHEVYEERIEESNHIGGPLTVLVPEERRLVRRDVVTRSERDIKEEIRALEHERRMLKYERDSDYEIIERREPKREVIRVDKDRKVRKDPKAKYVAAAIATLT